MERDVIRQRFTEIISRRDVEIDLAEAALFIAKEEYLDLDIEGYLSKLDRMAAVVRERIRGEIDPYQIIVQINRYLFDEEGFFGNTYEYYEPMNSFLNDVLERKTGIPITLSVIYLEIGRRLNFPLVGVGLPGHFIIKHISSQREILIDPFTRGKILSEEECAEMLNEIYGKDVPFRREFLASTPKKQMLARILTNLKGIYLHLQDYPRALSAVERILLINPRTPQEIRDRGMVYYKLEALPKAMIDFETYLKLAPDAQDASIIKQNIQLLGRLIAMMN